MPYTRPTPEERAAREAERAAKDLAQHIALHEALGNLIAAKTRQYRPMGQKMLQAEFDYAKAMHELYSDDCTKEMLADAAAALGVDEDGNDVEPDRDGYCDYLYEQMRDRQLDDQMRRDGLA